MVELVPGVLTVTISASPSPTFRVACLTMGAKGIHIVPEAVGAKPFIRKDCESLCFWNKGKENLIRVFTLIVFYILFGFCNTS